MNKGEKRKKLKNELNNIKLRKERNKKHKNKKK